MTIMGIIRDDIVPKAITSRLDFAVSTVIPMRRLGIAVFSIVRELLRSLSVLKSPKTLQITFTITHQY